MESIDDSNSSDVFENFAVNDNSSHIRNSMEGCLSEIEDTSEVSKDGHEETSSGTTKKINFQSIPRVPRVAVQEKLIICVENSPDKGLGYSFSDLDESSKTPNTYAIRNEVIKLILINKLALAKDTEFAIASVEPGKLKWLSPLTSNLSILMKSLGENKCTFNEEGDDFDITSIFSNVLKLIDIPENTNVTIIPPNYIIRVIFIYSSSFLVPQINTEEPSYLKFALSPSCFLDILYLHEQQSDFNNVERIYQEFGKILPPSSYLLECSRDVTKVFNSAVKLLAHPNQRITETMWNF